MGGVRIPDDVLIDEIELSPAGVLVFVNVNESSWIVRAVERSVDIMDEFSSKIESVLFGISAAIIEIQNQNNDGHLSLVCVSVWGQLCSPSTC